MFYACTSKSTLSTNTNSFSLPEQLRGRLTFDLMAIAMTCEIQYMLTNWIIDDTLRTYWKNLVLCYASRFQLSESLIYNLMQKCIVFTQA